MRAVTVLLLAGAHVTLAGTSPSSGADTASPSQPGPIGVTNITDRGASLRWTKSTDDVDVVGYRIYRGVDSASASGLELIASIDGWGTSYTVRSLLSGIGYRFGVTAIDAANNESPMSTTTFRTQGSTDNDPPEPPSNGSLTTFAFSSSRIDITWGTSPSPDAALYELLRDGVVIGTTQRPVRERFSDNGLAASTSYGYSVRTVDSAGNRSVPTTVKTRTTLAEGEVKIARGPYISAVTPTSAVISWWTNIPTPGSVVVDGSSVDDARGTRLHHEVLVDGLEPATTYPYVVTGGSATANGNLRTPAEPGQTFSFAVLGDFGGQGAAEQQNANNIAGAGTAFVQTVGDNIYPSAGFPDPDFATTYSDFDARFFKQFRDVIRNQAFFPANGDKEYFSNGQFWDAFPLPGGSRSWYSYDWGDAHILVLDTEQPFVPGTDQYAFATGDLAAHQSAAWRIVIAHGPPYSSTSAGASADAVRSALVPLFEQQNVALVMSGNSHNYERSHPLLDGSPVDSGGVTYVVTGAGGNGLNAFSASYDQPAWSAYRTSDFYSFTKVTVAPGSLTVSGIRADTNSVFDTVEITRDVGVDTQAPSAPGSLTAGVPSETAVPLSWEVSSDDVGVIGYELYRDDGPVPVATTGDTTYTDTGLAPATSYSYTVRAVDAAGNRSPDSNRVGVTTVAAGTVVKITAVEDRTIDPADAKPLNSRLKVDAASPTNDMLLKFVAPDTCTSITRAVLRLTVGTGTTDPSRLGGDFYATSPDDPHADWDDTTVTWDTAPAKDTALASAGLPGPVVQDSTYTVDVTGLVPSDGGTFTIRGSSTSADGAGYLSTEASATNGPSLDLTCVSAGVE